VLYLLIYGFPKSCGTVVNTGIYLRIKYVRLLLKLELYKVITLVLQFITKSLTVFTQYIL
jgi:hypothetical protein